MTHASDRRRWILLAALLAGAALIPLAAHAYLGSYGRYIADDFCTASTLRRFGFLESQAYWYQTWSGRYAYTFVVSLTQAAGPSLTPWLPSLALLAWMGAVLYAARQFLGARFPLPAGLALAALAVFTTLQGSPSVYQSLYWQTGMVTYTLPLILGVAYGAWLWRAAGGGRPASTVLACGISLVAAFALGGFSETYVVLQTTTLGLLLVLLPFVITAQRRRAAAIVGAGLLGSVLSALTIVLAPGTQVRRSLMPPPPDLASLVEASVRDEYLFLARTVKGHPEAIFLAILVPCLLIMLWQVGERGEPGAEGTGKAGWIAIVLLPVLTPVLMLSTFAPYEYAVSSYPDARVLITAMFVLVASLMAWGAILGTRLIRWPLIRSRPMVRGVLLAAVGVGFLLLVTSLRAASATMGEADAARAYAQSWETRDRALRQAASDNADQVAAASLRHMGGLAEIGRDPEEWINRCVAGTYGVGSVVAK